MTIVGIEVVIYSVGFMSFRLLKYGMKTWVQIAFSLRNSLQTDFLGPTFNISAHLFSENIFNSLW